MDVRGDSIIQIISPKGKKTNIPESWYEENGYKAKGWKVVKTDWTKERKVKERVDISEHLATAKMAEGAFKKQ